jgi:hypothetical protein
MATAATAIGKTHEESRKAVRADNEDVQAEPPDECPEAASRPSGEPHGEDDGALKEAFVEAASKEDLVTQPASSRLRRGSTAALGSPDLPMPPAKDEEEDEEEEEDDPAVREAIERIRDFPDHDLGLQARWRKHLGKVENPREEARRGLAMIERLRTRGFLPPILEVLNEQGVVPVSEATPEVLQVLMQSRLDASLASLR